MFVYLYICIFFVFVFLSLSYPVGLCFVSITFLLVINLNGHLFHIISHVKMSILTIEKELFIPKNLVYFTVFQYFLYAYIVLTNDFFMLPLTITLTGN